MHEGQMMSDHSPRISVVMPVYNEIATIEEILVRVQDLDLEKEIVIVNDGSTDGTRELLTKIGRCAEMAQPQMTLPHSGAVLRTDNIRVFFQAQNREKEQPCAGGSRKRAVTSSLSRMPTWNTIRRIIPA